MQPDLLPKPGSLEAKFKLLALLPYDSRARRKHMLVYGFILDWYHSKYGDALASVRHILAEIKERDPSGKGLYSGDVHSAITDLVAWGYLNQEKGSGRRASRYVPIWSKLSSVHKTPNATEDGISVLETPNASVRESPNATDVSVHKTPNEDPSTRTRLQDRGTGIDGPTVQSDCAAPSAPPGAGLDAPAPAGTAQGFDELWLFYDFKREKKKARTEYAKLSPSPELHHQIVESARAWKEAWAAQDRPDAPRRHLHIWLRDECYDEEPPTAYKPKERKITASRKNSLATVASEPPAPANDNRPAPRLATITSSRLEETERSRAVIFNAVAEDGEAIEIYISYEHEWQWAQEAGQQNLTELARAVGIDQVEDTEDLHNIPFLLGQNEAGGHTYLPAPESAKEQRNV